MTRHRNSTLAELRANTVAALAVLIAVLLGAIIVQVLR
jgi:hypothetical protein